MGRHDPSRKRRSHKWKVRRSLKIRIGTQPKQPEKVSSEKEPDEQRTITPNLKAMAPLLWASDYTPLLAKEQSELASLGLLESAVNLKAQAPQSTYMARGLVNNREKSDKETIHAASERFSSAGLPQRLEGALRARCMRLMALGEPLARSRPASWMRRIRPHRTRIA